MVFFVFMWKALLIANPFVLFFTPSGHSAHSHYSIYPVKRSIYNFFFFTFFNRLWSRGRFLTRRSLVSMSNGCWHKSNKPYKDVPSSVSAVLMPGAFQTLNRCQGKSRKSVVYLGDKERSASWVHKTTKHCCQGRFLSMPSNSLISRCQLLIIRKAGACLYPHHTSLRSHLSNDHDRVIQTEVAVKRSQVHYLVSNFTRKTFPYVALNKGLCLHSRYMIRTYLTIYLFMFSTLRFTRDPV